MIAYLYHDISSLGIPQVFLITAKITSRAIALAKGRYAYMAAVKTGKPQRLVQITGFLQGTERSFLPSAAMGFAQNLCKSFCQPLSSHTNRSFPLRTIARTGASSMPACISTWDKSGRYSFNIALC
ncbi:hypothetical protein, partial [Ruthenibacterium lactatiformans]|uniref:hypothetical protein n=1 Tax=Ruthenibacterium lactatiformans TaxID=1550024 RepID=UPI0022E9405F